MVEAFVWLLAIELLGLLAFSFTFVLLPGLRDRGYAFAKPLGLLLLGYPVWLLGSLRLMPSQRWSILLVMAALAAVAVVMALRQRGPLAAYLRRQWRLLLAIEGVFLIAYFAWLLFRAYSPDIAHTEQPMDLAFLSASARATHFPPEDPWLRGHGISYYYFGYLLMGLLAKVTGIATPVAYNLALSLVAALASVGVFGLVVDVVASLGGTNRTGVFWGLVGVVLLGVISNLEGILELLRALGVGSAVFWKWLGIKGLEGPLASTTWHPTDGWWWWRATRVIDTVVDGRSLDYTIQEFPFFSFMLGDLHPHVMSIPFVLLALAFGLHVLHEDGCPGLGWLRRRWPMVLVMGLVLGALGFVNLWDLPVFLLLALALLVLAARKAAAAGHRRLLLGWLATAAALVFVALVPYLPYYRGLESQVSGVLPVTGHATRPLHFLVVWGPFVAALLPFLVMQLWAAAVRRPRAGSLVLAVALAVAPFVLWGMVAMFLGMEDKVAGRFVGVLPLMAVAALAVYRALVRARQGDAAAPVFTLALVAVASFLLMGPELFFVVDFFNNRMNTVFKVYYQAWIVLAVATPLALYSWHRWSQDTPVFAKAIGLLWGLSLVVLLLGLFYYPAAGVASWVQSRKGAPSLDGLAYLKQQRPGQYAAIQWLRAHSRPGDVILEAPGESYNAASNMVSAATGLPTVLGWVGHELQWRGSSRPMDGRAEAATAIYKGQDAAQVAPLLERYGVSYVVLGEREKRLYGVQSLDGLKGILAPAFAKDEVVIYRVVR